MGQIQRRLRKAARSHATFRDYFKYLDIHPPKSMRKDHAQRVVQLHGQDYGHQWESLITRIRTSQEAAESFAGCLTHYTLSTLEQLKAYVQELGLASEQLDHIRKAITKDERILRKYVGFIYRLRRALRSLC